MQVQAGTRSIGVPPSTPVSAPLRPWLPLLCSYFTVHLSSNIEPFCIVFNAHLSYNDGVDAEMRNPSCPISSRQMPHSFFSSTEAMRTISSCAPSSGFPILSCPISAFLHPQPKGSPALYAENKAGLPFMQFSSFFNVLPSPPVQTATESSRVRSGRIAFQSIMP